VVKSLGIDPGTKSFDLVLLDNGEVAWESSVPTEEVASRPERLTEELSRLEREVDMIVGPSGYGAPYICNDDIIEPKIFASEVLLLTSLNKLKQRTEDLGFAVYRALYRLVVELWKKKINVCYIPSVKQLQTVDLSYKINRIDLGTADKLASAFLASYILYNETEHRSARRDFFLLELGFGYNALISVRESKIAGGLGGTSLGPGFLTPGPLDLEVVVSGKWKRSSVWDGGVGSICSAESMIDLLTREKSIECSSYLKAMILSIRSGLSYLGFSGNELIVASGRWAGAELLKLMEEELGIKFFLERPKLKGARTSKEAAQGMAMIGDAITGGKYAPFFNSMMLMKAKGTVMDHIYLPSLREAVTRHLEAYRKSIKADRAHEVLY